MLLEISLAVNESEGHKGNAQVGGGPQGVTSQYAEATGIGGHGGVDGDLHGEVGDKS